ncbi:creatininase family protein [Sulfitobacter mediterraneus]|nr:MULTISPECIES: creatininase family protein [Sulfitobacter]MBM1641358.1 creatininase family protein [Sulfitobacter mediterraneus]MBM1645992.1 creatininase family protein [Sulfitobacter mediterraneus]MBM1654060.1 creatininase family protein [Sulfitobacter mediterraneus]MBM1657571.1 creatininase family protein [Sulfitobacter mediterraneus]MBM1666224.1 creatininase family protein [Sulfitobacter mediterraneus]
MTPKEDRMIEVEWQNLKAHELRRLADENAVVILPIASIEQHGPHLPTMTDTRLGHEVAIRAARKASGTRPVVVTPVVWSGLSEHHMPFGGTLTVSHATFRALVRDLVLSITRHGFRDILISNSHGGNIIAMHQICDELAPEVPATLVATTYPMEAAEEVGGILEDQDGMQHACEAETSMMMALVGDLVDSSDMGALASKAVDGPTFLRAGKASYRWRPFTHLTGNGVAGNPARATADKGERLIEVSADALAAMIADPDTWAAPEDLRGAETGGVPFRPGT